MFAPETKYNYHQYYVWFCQNMITRIGPNYEEYRPPINKLECWTVLYKQWYTQ